LLLGVVAFDHWGSGTISAALTLPLVLRDLTPLPVLLLGLGAIVGAVTSSLSASLLSAASMFSWNVYRRLLSPGTSARLLKLVVRGSILAVGVVSLVLALKVGSIAALWLFTGDLVFVLLFPQLVIALYDRRANRIGSVCAFTVSLVLRVGGGIAIFSIPAAIPYAQMFAGVLPGDVSAWTAEDGSSLLPIRTLSAVAGLILLPLVSRLTARWDPPRPLHA
jgi:high affinity choline transporter 7